MVVVEKEEAMGGKVRTVTFLYSPWEADIDYRSTLSTGHQCRPLGKPGSCFLDNRPFCDPLFLTVFCHSNSG